MRIFSFRPGKLEVLSAKLKDASNTDKFGVRVEPMSEATLKAEEDAQSGAVSW